VAPPYTIYGYRLIWGDSGRWDMTKVFFTTDIHGSEICFKKFVAAGKFYEADVVVMGGDCTGKMLVPVIHSSNGRYTSRYLDRDWRFSDEEELVVFERKVKNAGYYPVRLERDQFEELQSDEEKVDQLFLDTMLSTLEGWLQYAEDKLRGTGVRCIITPGNDDHQAIDDLLKQSETVVAAEGEVVWLDDHHELLSVGWTNPTPWNTPRECSEPELRSMIDRLADQVKDMERAVFNLHAPPHGSGLDEAPELDESLAPKRGGTIWASVGSTAVRDAIEEHQPLMGLHGHIHEQRGACHIGRTLCVNPGSNYGEGALNGVLFELGKKKIKSYLLTMG